MTINLFNAYQVASDGKSVSYIKKNRDQYDDGNNITKDELMNSNLIKYDITRKDNNWNSMYPEQEQTVALTYVIEKLKDDNLKLYKNFKSAPPRNHKRKGKCKG